MSFVTTLDVPLDEGTEPAGVIASDSYVALSLHDRLQLLSDMAMSAAHNRLALEVYRLDGSLPSIEDWLFKLEQPTRSPLVAWLYVDGHTFSRAVVTPTGVRMAEGKLAKDRVRLAELQEAKNDSYTASGDTWHDNPGFKDLEQSVDRLDKDIRRREKLLTYALLIDRAPAVTSQQVTIGSDVSYRQVRDGGGSGFSIDGKIVGMFEADPDEDRYTYETPVAQALRGLRQGDSRRYELPGGWFTFEVLELA